MISFLKAIKQEIWIGLTLPGYGLGGGNITSDLFPPPGRLISFKVIAQSQKGGDIVLAEQTSLCICAVAFQVQKLVADLDLDGLRVPGLNCIASCLLGDLQLRDSPCPIELPPAIKKLWINGFLQYLFI